MSDDDRYEREPWYRILELYVLWSIGTLTEVQRNWLLDVTPVLHEAFGKTGTWREIVEDVVGLSEEAPADIRRLWRINVKAARQSHVALTPQRFAEIFVKENFRDGDDDDAREG